MQKNNYSFPEKRGKDLTVQCQIQMINDFQKKNLKKCVQTTFGTTRQIIFQERLIVQHKPHILRQNPTLLIHLHGSRGYCWQQALFRTRWIQNSQKENLIIIFGQANGVSQFPHKHKQYSGISFGQRYWQIRDAGENKKGFQNDIKYIQGIITSYKQKQNCKKVIVSGQSNGGVFCCLLAVYLKNLIDGIYSSMGGIGWDPYFCIDFSKGNQNQIKKPKMFFLTGTHDIHLQPTKIAYEIFKGEGYDCKLQILQGIKHIYQYQQQANVLQYFLKN